ncbi:MAG: (4Fe-4S)-binding protein [Solirubrobacteraceae bacterium]
MTVKRYPREGAVVTFDPGLCRHAAECVRGLPQVFDTAKRPWIQPGNASVDELATVISSCPSGALHLETDDGRRFGR